jgi:uncharacterized membrane protein YgcG
MSSDVLIIPDSGYLAFTSSIGKAIELQVTESNGIPQLYFRSSSGSLFLIEDNLSGTLFSVNNISGIPVFRAFSDDRIIMGEFGQDDFILSGNMVGIGTSPSAKLHISGNVRSETGFTGSLTQLTNGNPYIQTVGSLTVTTQSDGSLLFSGSGGSSSGGSGTGSCDVFETFMPMAAPPNPSSFDDEFKNTTGSQWSIWDPTSNITVTTENNKVALSRPSLGGDNWGGLVQPAPSGSFTVYSHVSYTALRSNFYGSGIFIGEDLINNPSTDRVVPLVMSRRATEVELQAFLYADYNSFSSTFVTEDFFQATDAWFRMRVTSGSASSTPIQLDYSTDGIGWTRVYSGTIAFRPQTMGIITNNGGGETAITYADFFRVVEGTDEFQGQTGNTVKLVTGSCSGGGSSSGGGTSAGFSFTGYDSNGSNTSEKWFRLNGAGAGGTSTAKPNIGNTAFHWNTPFSGSMRKITMVFDNDPGLTTVRIYKDFEATASITGTMTPTLKNGDYYGTVDFDIGSREFDPETLLIVSFDPTSNHQDASMTAFGVYDNAL